MASKRYPAGPLQTPRKWYVHVTVLNPQSNKRSIRTYWVDANSISEAIMEAKKQAIAELNISVKNLDVHEAGIK